MFNTTGKEVFPKDKINTIIAEGVVIDGDLQTNGSIRLEGKVIGNIETEGDLLVGKTGKVEANVQVSKISIAGIVEGDIVASEKVEILAQGKLKGNIQTPLLKVEEGASFIGFSNNNNEKEIDSSKNNIVEVESFSK